MGVLHLLAYGGGLAAFLFVTLSLASGLLWLAELIEEHSRYAKTIGMRAIYTIIGLHVLLVFTDSLPILPTLLSIAAHLVYLSNFSSSWPYISLTSPRFLLSCLFVVTDHFTWFFHFAAKAQEAKKYRGPKYRYGANSGARVPDVAPAFMDVAAFFAVCVWFVPLYLFLSLSANDNALPSLHSMASAPPSPSIHPRTIDLNTPQDLHGSGPLPRRRSRAQASTTLVKAALSPLISLLPKLRSSSKRLNDEGFLTPRTPVRGSPLHTPVHMPQSYFPWGGDDPEETMRSALSSASGSSIQRSPSPNYPSLGVADGASSRQRLSIGRLKTPPPPRRVQSEAAGLGMNPRGIATRNGVPASTPVNGNPERSSPPRQDKSGQGTAGGPPKVSLGPKEGEAFAVGEVIDSVDAGKKKAD